MAAEDVLHDLGAISMIGSDSQAMGRVGETIIRTWQTAHAMKLRRGPLPGDGGADNERARRYVAKYSICPAVAHGIDASVGSVEVGKLADLVLWDPAFFAIRPRLVIKGGAVACAPMGDANASIPTPQPVLGAADVRRGAGAAAPSLADVRVAPAALATGWRSGSEAARRLRRRSATRARRQGRHGRRTTPCPRIAVEPDTFVVTDRRRGHRRRQPATELPLAQRYSLF